jgi:GT2 family glycosyltransferase
MTPQVIVIVLNWNGLSDTLECLTSLASLDYPAHEVVVVDNGSTDDSVETIRARFPQVTLIQNGANLGFAEGNNVGLRYALERAADYVLLLNNDTIVDPGFLTELVAVAEARPEIGVASPLIFYYDATDEIWTAGAAINWANGATRRLRAGETARQGEPAFGVDFVSGCALLVKREVVEKTGLLDPDYYLYYEETDWCVRVHKQGYRIVCVPQAKIWHKVSRSLGASSPLTSYYMTRNALLLLRKHLTGSRRLLSLGRNLTGTARSVAAIYLKRKNAHRRPNARAQLRGVWDFVRGRYGALPTPDQRGAT